MSSKEFTFYEKLNTEYEELYAKQGHSNIKREWDSIRMIFNELKWQSLSDSEKQERRIGSLSLGKKWDKMDGDNDDFTFNQITIDLYDLLEKALTLLSKQASVEDTLIFRVEAILSLEKSFINEHLNPSKLRHNDYYVMNGLLDECREESFALYRSLALDKVQDTFNSMYKLWDRRPYKEII